MSWHQKLVQDSYASETVRLVFEFQKRMHSRATMEGIDRARQQGVRIGRPRREWDTDTAIALHETGISFRNLAKLFGVGVGTVFRACSKNNKKRSLRMVWYEDFLNKNASDEVRELAQEVFKFQKKIQSDRVKQGLERARKEGKQLGRKGRNLDSTEALQLRDAGLSLRDISKKTGIPTSTLCRYFQNRGR